MKRLLALFCAVWLTFFSFHPSFAQDSRRPFLAVFTSPDLLFVWPSYKPDILHVAFCWDNFDGFLEEICQKAGDRPIELDLEVHGHESLSIHYLDWNTGKEEAKYASVGYVINHIEKKLAGKDYTLILESCYGGNTYVKSIRNNTTANKFFEDCDHIPLRPVWGSSYNHMNLNNCVYLQYKTGLRYAFVDLRKFEVEKGDRRLDTDQNSKFHRGLSQFFQFLASYYKPYD